MGDYHDSICQQYVDVKINKYNRGIYADNIKKNSN